MLTRVRRRAPGHLRYRPVRGADVLEQGTCRFSSANRRSVGRRHPASSEDVACDFPSVATISVASRMRVHPDDCCAWPHRVHALLFEEDRAFPSPCRVLMRPPRVPANEIVGRDRPA